MGAISFFESTKGINARNAYDELVQQAVAKHGYDSYNGTISTTDGFMVVKKYDKFSNTKKVQNEVEKTYTNYINRGGGGDCFCIDRGVVGYLRKELITTTKKATAKYKMMYALVGYIGEKVYKTADTVKELQEYYKELVEMGKTEDMKIVKRSIQVSGEETCKEFRVVRKEFASKPKATKNTISIDEIHQYDFFGWARE